MTQSFLLESPVKCQHFISLSGFLQTRLDIVRLIRGRSCTIQGTHSDTQLHIPEGVYAALLGNIHTNPSKFRHHIPPNDCLVAPICEYHLQPFIGEVLPKDAKYSQSFWETSTLTLTSSGITFPKTIVWWLLSVNTTSIHSLGKYYQKMLSTKSVYLTLSEMCGKSQRASESDNGTFTDTQSYLFTKSK